MDTNWIRSSAGRWVVVVGFAVIVAVALVAAFGGSDDDRQSEVGPTAPLSASTADEDTLATTPGHASTSTPQRAGTAGIPPASSGGGASAPETMQTVAVGTVVELDPIPLDDTGDFGTGLSVRLAAIEPIDGEARSPGEISGPALRVTVEATNRSDQPISLARSQIEVTYGADRTPGIALSGSGTTPFDASVAPGASSSAVVVFVVPTDQRTAVQVAVTQTTGSPIVLFEGPTR